MNALYVTVSIPLLLLLAGFNHAHGLTTFGKTQSNNNAPPPQPPAKTCTNHTTCNGINGASCVQDPRDHHKKSCLCGDNVPPQNGICKANYRGPNHRCTENIQCVEGAKCVPLGKNPPPNGDKACKCMEGLVESHNMCNGGIPLSALSGLIVLMSAIARTLLFN
ncbi:uncharacterized protein sosie [Atheta coriaria]|uniref:uncharacterized protein sosie n=1 Tax=Dalotia coriaria TaxID=877792 RepID=UPI0031F390D8